MLNSEKRIWRKNCLLGGEKPSTWKCEKVLDYSERALRKQSPWVWPEPPPPTWMKDPQYFWEFHSSSSTAILNWKGQRGDKIKNDSEGRVAHTEARGSTHRWLFSSPETKWNLLCWLSDLLGASDPFIASIVSLLEWECPSYACPTTQFWKQMTNFLGFIDPQVQRNLDPCQTTYRVSPDLEDEIWDSKLMIE